MIDVSQNRQTVKWTPGEKVGRVLWAMASPSFRWSPRIFWGWRRMLLRLFGAKIGKHVHVYPSARITMPWHVSVGDFAAIGDRAILYALGPITIGARSVVSQYAHLCAGSHDWRDPAMPLLKQPIEIGADVWICADAFVGPGVKIGDHAVIGARAVVMKDVAANVVGHGNPFRISKLRGDAK
jgi:putative colanic acid biosynthesis acetyltransferase WcaF